jgi:hypothetical protein
MQISEIPMPVIRSTTIRLKPDSRSGDEIHTQRPLRPSQRDILQLILRSGGCLVDVLSARPGGRPLDMRVLRGLERTGHVEQRSGMWFLTELGSGSLDDTIVRRTPPDEQDDASLGLAARIRRVIPEFDWQSRFAAGIGVPRDLVQKWASGSIEVPAFVITVLEMLERLKSLHLPLPDRFGR